MRTEQFCRYVWWTIDDLASGARSDRRCGAMTTDMGRPLPAYRFKRMRIHLPMGMYAGAWRDLDYEVEDITYHPTHSHITGARLW